MRGYNADRDEWDCYDVRTGNFYKYDERNHEWYVVDFEYDG